VAHTSFRKQLRDRAAFSDTQRLVTNHGGDKIILNAPVLHHYGRFQHGPQRLFRHGVRRGYDVTGTLRRSSCRPWRTFIEVRSDSVTFSKSIRRAYCERTASNPIPSCSTVDGCINCNSIDNAMVVFEHMKKVRTLTVTVCNSSRNRRSLQYTILKGLAIPGALAKSWALLRKRNRDFYTSDVGYHRRYWCAARRGDFALAEDILTEHAIHVVVVDVRLANGHPTSKYTRNCWTVTRQGMGNWTRLFAILQLMRAGSRTERNPHYTCLVRAGRHKVDQAKDTQGFMTVNGV
jgi:hypothetical protein